MSDHLGESLDIVHAEARHGELLRVVAQAGEIKKHLPKNWIQTLNQILICYVTEYECLISNEIDFKNQM